MPKTTRLVLLVLFFASGSAGLIYELAWVRRLTLVFGGTTYAVTTAVAAFMAGLGLGGYLAGRWAKRLAQPGRVYGLLEVAVGLSAALVPVLLWGAEPLYRAMYRAAEGATVWLTLIRFLVGFLVLMAPTTLMGATLPVLVRYLTEQGERVGRTVGLLYGVNTVGAVAGTFLAGFLLLPLWGQTASTCVAVALNLLVGGAAVFLLRPRRREREGSPPPRPPAREMPRADEPGPLDARPDVARLAALIAVTVSGFASMVYQIAWTRLLVMSIGSSTYAFTCILGAFILGLGGGSLLIARWADRLARPVRWLGLVQAGIAVAAVLLIHVYGRLPDMAAWAFTRGTGAFGEVLAGSLGLVILVTAVPTLLMGATFPLAVRVIAAAGRDTGGAPAATGRAIALNTCGTIAGSILAGFFLIRGDVLGVRGSIVAAAALNGLLGSGLLILGLPSRRGRLRYGAALAAGMVALPVVAMGPWRWDLLRLSSAPFLGRSDRASLDRRLVYYGEGVDATVSVERHGQHLSMAINGQVNASTDTGDMITQLLLGHLPAALAEDGRGACVIGLGSGITLAAVARHPSYERIDCLEISEEVIRAAAMFAPYNGNVMAGDARIRVIRGDGRNHLLLTDRRYDVISSEPSNLWVSGEALLFTREFFRLCRDRLTDRGILCVWLHAYSIRAKDFQSVVRTLGEVFEWVSLWEGSSNDMLLLAGRRGSPVPLDGVLRRLSEPRVRADLYRVGLGDPARLLGTFIASGAPLRSWARPGRLHTDDDLHLEYAAPRSLYQVEGSEVVREIESIQCSPFVDALTLSMDDARHRELSRRLAATRTARTARIAALAAARGDPSGALSQLADACRDDPGNVLAWLDLLEGRAAVSRLLRKAPSPQAIEVLARIDSVRPATIAPRSPECGATLADVARMLRARAHQAVLDNRWDLVRSYLEEAASLEDDLGADAIALAFALDQAGRIFDAIPHVEAFLRRQPDHPQGNLMRARLAARLGDTATALAHIEKALASGKILPDQVMADPAFRAVAGHPRFAELLRPTSQPTSQPASPPGDTGGTGQGAGPVVAPPATQPQSQPVSSASSRP